MDQTGNTEVLNKNVMDEDVDAPEQSENAERPDAVPEDCKREASWPSVLFYIHLNILGLYGILILFTHTKLITIIFCE